MPPPLFFFFLYITAAEMDIALQEKSLSNSYHQNKSRAGQNGKGEEGEERKKTNRYSLKG